ncbi:unnamed protein product [Phaedon cochleariae]|uniref:rRNA-processing protein UTP23 homolog n=1 Tax=Phaedon cochleariae TaxID=80249 RepID=A0A9P0GY86_PHACE|nr:unnamed protein product [Phaedon cochleariae]
MKVKRYKKVHKHLGFFTHNYGFRQPYQILVDGTFCLTALNNKINIADNIPRYLQADVKLITTQCAIIEMENLGPKLNGALIILKMYTIHKCGHEGKPISGSKCILSMLGKTNENHYIIATQDRDLQTKIRNKPGVPLLYLHIKTPVLEQPSEASVITAKNRLSLLQGSEREALEKLKEENGLAGSQEKIRKKKKKGPNPLSCKKRKAKSSSKMIVAPKERKPHIESTKRKRIKIPKHVRDELMKK